MIRKPIAMSNGIPIAQTANKTHIGKVVIAAIVGGVIAVFFYFDLGRYLSLEALKQHRDQLVLFADAHYAASILLFILAYVVVAGLALPGAVILTLAGGFLYALNPVYPWVVASAAGLLAVVVAVGFVSSRDQAAMRFR